MNDQSDQSTSNEAAIVVDVEKEEDPKSIPMETASPSMEMVSLNLNDNEWIHIQVQDDGRLSINHFDRASGFDADSVLKPLQSANQRMNGVSVVDSAESDHKITSIVEDGVKPQEMDSVDLNGNITKNEQMDNA